MKRANSIDITFRPVGMVCVRIYVYAPRCLWLHLQPRNPRSTMTCHSTCMLSNRNRYKLGHDDPLSVGEWDVMPPELLCGFSNRPQIQLDLAMMWSSVVRERCAGSCMATVQHNNVHGNRAGGMHVLGDAKPAVSENTFFSNSQVGLLVSGRSRPVFRINRIQGNQVGWGATARRVLLDRCGSPHERRFQ